MNGKQNALGTLASDMVLTSDFLLEFLEGELEESLDFDVEILLTDSVADWSELQRLQATKELIKSTDDICLPEDGHYYDRRHASIMQAISNESTGDTRSTTRVEAEAEAGVTKSQGESART